MVQFEWLWALLCLPLPLLVRWLIPATHQPLPALSVPFIDDFEQQQTITVIQRKAKVFLASIIWVALVIAASRPQWLDEPIQLPQSGRDLLLAVDLSLSMQEEDFMLQGRQVNRLVATKSVASEFIEQREGDRIGLILYGSEAYLQAPLTFDRETVKTLLNESQLGLAGKQTAIGDAIGLAIKRFDDSKIHKPILILMTDGQNTAGSIAPLKAAKLAAQEKMKIYTIGIGADSRIVSTFFGNRRINPSRDLDVKTLTQIAELTGGQFFRATDTESMGKIYALINELEPVESDQRTYRPVQSLFFWPLGFALLLASLLILTHLLLPHYE